MNKRIFTAILSAVLPGAGQLYYHHWIKGIGFLGGAMLLSGMVRRQMMGASSSPTASLFVHLFLLGLAIWSAIDAYRSQD